MPHVNSFSSHNKPVRRSVLRHEGPKDQRGLVTCAKSHSKEVAKLNWNAAIKCRASGTRTWLTGKDFFREDGP